MSVSTQFALSEVTLTGATLHRITNVDAPTANTEYSLALSANLKSITIRSRLVSKVQFAFVSGESDVTYMTIPAGASFSQSNLTLAATTLYFQTNIDSNTLEVLEFF